jgi:hypothetical protein
VVVRCVVVRCVVLALAVLLVPKAAPAQGFFRATPAFAVAQVYDSNLYSSSFDRQADFITRVTPGIAFEYRSRRWTVSDGLTADLEHFAGHPELKGANARQHAVMSVDYRPTRRLLLAAGTEFSNTHTPSELNAATGLTFTRAQARRIAANSAIRWQLNRIATGALEYRVTEDRIVGGLASRTHAGILRAERHISSRDALSVRYHADQSVFGFDEAAVSRATSQALIVGWSRAIARQGRLSIDAGPRITNGLAASEMSGSVQYRLGSVDLSLAYSHTQTTIMGLPEMARTRSVTASTAWTFGRLFDVRVSPAYFRSAHTTLRADVYRLAGDIACRIADGLSMAVALERNVQHGDLYTGLSRPTIPRQTLMTRLVITPNSRP